MQISYDLYIRYPGSCLIDELFIWGIFDKENISDMIKIVDFEDSDENLDNDFDFSENVLGK
jgi:hypothetical protein